MRLTRLARREHPAFRVSRLYTVAMKLSHLCFFLFSFILSSGEASTEKIIYIPHGSASLETTLYLPDGEGPFPLVVINHGKGDKDAHLHSRFRAAHASEFFTQLGYAVALPMREGFAGSTGWERANACEMEKTGIEQAKSIQSAINYLTQQPYVDNTRIIVVGYSYGGFASLAYGAEFPHKNVKAIINFSGGISRRGGGCVWTEKLLDAVKEFGKKTRIPSLWIYAENDQLFPEWLARGMHLRYELAGGNSALLITPPYSNDGHSLFVDHDGRQLWQEVVRYFLEHV